MFKRSVDTDETKNLEYVTKIGVTNTLNKGHQNKLEKKFRRIRKGYQRLRNEYKT